MSIHSTGIGKHDPRVADIITATIPEFCRISGIGRSKTYELIASGVIESIRCGNRRLVVVDSWRKLVDAAPRDLGPQPMPPTAPPRRPAAAF
jgi:excisionase family DNA binding protein